MAQHPDISLKNCAMSLICWWQGSQLEFGIKTSRPFKVLENR